MFVISSKDLPCSSWCYFLCMLDVKYLFFFSVNLTSVVSSSVFLLSMHAARVFRGSVIGVMAFFCTVAAHGSFGTTVLQGMTLVAHERFVFEFIYDCIFAFIRYINDPG